MSGQFRALLIGIPEYRDETFPGMPFIEDDLIELADALTKSGYNVESHDRKLNDRDSIIYAIENFIVRAKLGETLLVYLSGHGVHHNGVDYLVPSTAMAISSRFPMDNCVPIKCDDHISHTAAGSVLIVVDACREGVTLRGKSVSAVVGWSDWRRDRAVARKVAYLYACSPGETAGFSREGFSILSRALSQALLDSSRPATVEELLVTTQAKMNVLIVEHNVRHHTARLLTDVDQTKFVVVPRSGLKGEHENASVDQELHTSEGIRRHRIKPWLIPIVAVGIVVATSITLVLLPEKDSGSEASPGASSAATQNPKGSTTISDTASPWPSSNEELLHACKLLDMEHVAQFMKVSNVNQSSLTGYGMPLEEAFRGIEISSSSGCTWQSDGKSNAQALEIIFISARGDDPAVHGMFETALQKIGQSAPGSFNFLPVSGVGDEAAMSDSPHRMLARRSNRLLFVSATPLEVVNGEEFSDLAKSAASRGFFF